MRYKITFLILLFSVVLYGHNESSVDESNIILYFGPTGGNEYFNLFNSLNTDFDGLNFGSFECDDTFILSGAPQLIHKCSDQDVIFSALNFSIEPDGFEAYFLNDFTPDFRIIDTTPASNPGPIFVFTSAPNKISILKTCTLHLKVCFKLYAEYFDLFQTKTINSSSLNLINPSVKSFNQLIQSTFPAIFQDVTA